MTKLDAVAYGVSRYRQRQRGEIIPTILMERNGEYAAVTWNELDHAEGNGWHYVGSIADEAKTLHLL